MADEWIKHFEPRFVEAARTCALADAWASGKTVADYFETELGYVDYEPYQKLAKKLAKEDPKGPVVSTAHDNSLALAPLHFVYMDVGCWAGSGDKNMWPRHREFGLVYGTIAVLCAFGKDGEYARYGNPPSWESFGSAGSTPTIDATIRRHPNWKPVHDLLKSLAGILKVENLNLHILGATTVVSPYVPTPPCGPADPITVFIGDLHAPVVTRPSDAHLTDLGREMLRGRLDVNVVLERLPGGILPPADVLRVVAKAVEARGRMDWNRTTSSASMDEWFAMYHGRRERGADIFETAGADLRRFVDALAAFHGKTHPLEVVQLGDLFDLWLGFQCAFEGNADGLFGDALKFARHWVRRSLFHTEQGAHLVHFLTMGQWAGENQQTGAPLSTHFLYGNHDNYRKHGAATKITVPPGHEHAGLKIQPFPAPSSLDKPGLWAEHGHQADPNNRDDSPGTGHAATQLAFFAPTVRRLEGPSGWLGSALDPEGHLRVREIDHALDRCLLDHGRSSAPCRGIYVMGHSHEPMLKRVEFWPRTPQRNPRRS